MTENQEIRTFKLVIAFDGTNYHGWQKQPNAVTVQEVLEKKIRQLFGGAEIKTQGSSRTDAGVHSLGTCVSFKAPPSPYIPDWKVKKALNRLLPPEIRIISSEIADDSFNARFSAFGKSYIYTVNTGELNPFTNRYSWQLDDMTHTDELREAMNILQGKHDFSAFTVERGKIDDPVRTVLRDEVKTFGPYVCMYFLGDGFLYKMVRSMVGALSFVGRGKLPPEAIQTMLDSKDRCAARDTAPACGLCLKRVFYDDSSWQQDDFDDAPFRLERG